MNRRCSYWYCSNIGRFSSTCRFRYIAAAAAGSIGGDVKLFGVRLTDGSIIKKSASMGNLSSHYHSSSSAAASPDPRSPSSDLSREPVHVSVAPTETGAPASSTWIWPQIRHQFQKGKYCRHLLTPLKPLLKRLQSNPRKRLVDSSRWFLDSSQHIYQSLFQFGNKMQLLEMKKDQKCLTIDPKANSDPPQKTSQ